MSSVGLLSVDGVQKKSPPEQKQSEETEFRLSLSG